MPRPAHRFHDFIGHRPVVDRLNRLLDGARARKQPFPHTLFAGPSGVGKSKLAGTLAEAYGTKCLKVMGYKPAPELVSSLASLSPNAFLFVEEGHRLGLPEQKFLCEAIDEGSVPGPVPDPKDDKKTVPGRVALPPWTLVVATDQPGKFLDAFFNRLGNHIDLDFYPLHELKEIVEELARKSDVLVSPQAAKAIAEVAGGLPRRAEHLVKKLRLSYPDSETRQLSLEDFRAFLRDEGIDDNGLNPLEQRYLLQLSRFGAASLDSLALSLGTDTVHLRRHVEAGLIRRGLIRIAASGRQLTAAGNDWITSHSPTTSPTKDNEHDDDQGGPAAL